MVAAYCGFVTLARAEGGIESPILRELLIAAGQSGKRQAVLARFYGDREFRPVWFRDGKPAPEARQVLEVLGQAEGHGLVPADYPAAALAGRLARAADGRERAEADLALSNALFLFLADLHGGRVHPRRLGAELDMPAREPDVAALVREALLAGRIAELPDRLVPPFPMYAGLRQALVRYRDLARAPFEPLPVVKKLEPGQDYPALQALRDRLVRLGDLPPSEPVPRRYQGGIVEGMKHFQARHGLEADGVIGRGSFQALNVPFDQRARQIVLAMERLRWLRLPSAPRMVLVNIPEFRLRALDVKDGRAETRLAMNVIVGKAVLDKETPIFDEDMRSIDFQPFWNVPPSIAGKELLPKLRATPGYFADQDMEFVPVGGGAARREVTPEALEAVAQGRLRIRQKPGKKNPLGPIKFVLPNSHDVYLHYTSTPRLFQKARRDFSHGCIRVEEPVQLARFVLEDQPEWSEERIREAMAAEKPSSVRLARPVPVVIFYQTAVTEADGRVLFFQDIYGLDGKLEAALRERVVR